MTDDPFPLTDTTCRLIWSAVLASEFGIVLPIADPATCALIRSRLQQSRSALIAEGETQLRDYIIHFPEDCRSLIIKPRLANVLP